MRAQGFHSPSLAPSPTAPAWSLTWQGLGVQVQTRDAGPAGHGADAQRLLDGIDLRIEPGERIALLGANGSGKTTLLRVLQGVQAASSGQRLGDAAHAPRTQLLLQQPPVLRCSALAQLTLALALHEGCTSWRGWSQARTRAAAALQAVQLQAQAQQAVGTLSGGQRQRLALAAAWAMQSDLLLLDEPTASLDPLALREVMVALHTWQGGAESSRPSNPRSWLMATHHLGLVQAHASRVLYLEAGRLLCDAPVSDFFNPAWRAAHAPQAHRFMQEAQP